jgi:hypothetical protein
VLLQFEQRLGVRVVRVVETRLHQMALVVVVVVLTAGIKQLPSHQGQHIL